jgi:hypothetical protein
MGISGGKIIKEVKVHKGCRARGRRIRWVVMVFR